MPAFLFQMKVKADECKKKPCSEDTVGQITQDHYVLEYLIHTYLTHYQAAPT